MYVTNGNRHDTKPKQQLKKVAKHFITETEEDSNYRRIQRFLKEVELNYDEIAILIYEMFNFDKVTISIDRTNWKWGKEDINILMLSVVYKGIAIPLYWDLLDKKGNSNTQERIDLLAKFINNFGADKIEYILADREFIGEQWFTWLADKERDIKFCIRIRKNTKVLDTKGNSVQVQTLLTDVKQSIFTLHHLVKVHGCYVRIFAKRNIDGELMIIATNDIKQLNSITLYKKRWQIEVLFSCFKGRGFNLEETHVTEPNKIQKLIAVMSLAFCWCYKIGIEEDKSKPIQRKKHGRLSKSLFRLGLDLFHKALKQLLMFGRREYLIYLLSYVSLDLIPIRWNEVRKC